MVHRDLNSLGDVCGRSGHTTGTNVDSYADERNMLRGLPGGMALAGWEDTRAWMRAPHFACLTASDEILDRFITDMFTVSLGSFKRGGKLYCVLRICEATLVMYHNTVIREMGNSNVLSSKLMEVARKARISDSSFPQDAPELLLSRWSSILISDYKRNNNEVQDTSPTLQSVIALL